jgi:putative ABC transport system permease protein
VNASARLYRWLLRLYPAAFRDEYGEEMTWTFEEHVRRDGPWRAWPRALADAVRTAARTQLDVTGRDVRVAFRGLARTPSLTVTVVLVLALGIGATTGVSTVARQILWTPLPYAAPGDIGVVLQEGRSPVSPAQVRAIAAGTSSFARVEAAEAWGPIWTGGDHPLQLRALRVSPSLFATLGVPAHLGRTFTHTGDDRSVVVTHRFWQTRLGGASDVIGREVVLDQAAYTIVGVMPPTFAFSPFWAEGELFVPLDLPARGNSTAQSLRAFVRLDDAATWPRAQAELDAVTARLRQVQPEAHRDLALRVTPLEQKVTGDIRPLLLMLLAAVTCALLVTCVNVASLLLVRATRREPEMAVRAAIGAGATALARQLLTEGLLLAGGGTLLGLGVAWWLVTVATSITLPGVPRLDLVAVDTSTVVAAAVTGLLCGVAFSLAPAWSLRRRVSMGTRGTLEAAGAGALRRVFVVAQVALALLLVVGAGLIARGFARLTQVSPGFDVERVLSMQVSAVASPRWRDNRGELFTQLRARLARVPGIVSTGVVNHLPLAGDAWGAGFFVEGREDAGRVRAVYRVAAPGYLETMRMTLLDGRDISPRDSEDAPAVALVNAAFARQYLSDAALLGRRVSMTGDNEPRAWMTIVGIVQDVKQQEWAAPVEPEVYLPLRQSASFTSGSGPAFAAMTIVARTEGDPLALVPAAQRAVWEVDGDLAVSNMISLEQAMRGQLARPRAARLLMTAFGIGAVLLAATGIYGVVAFDAGRKTREIGLRLALGARPRRVVQLVLGRALMLIGMGLVIGLLGSAVVTRFLQALLYDVSARDPLVFGASTATLLVVGLAACLWPALRAARLDPVEALRRD